MGINVDHDVVGHQTGAVAITNEGTIEGLNGLAIRIRGDFADTITNLGTISGTAGAIDMGGGDDMLKLGEGSSIAGLIDGGDGFDTIEILDPPAIAVHLGTNVNFERLLIDDDAILALDADQDFDVVLGVVFNPDGSVANIYGEGFNVYYDPNDPLNGYLLGGTYALQEGGLLLAAAPVPATLALLAPGVIGLGWFRRKKAADRGTA
jgi:hypothetical protein